jgi:RHS repeat-associated protein
MPDPSGTLAKATPASTTFPLPDALGSTIVVTDQSGAVLERVFYSDAFGTPTFKDASGTALAGTTTGTRFLFTGREWLAALNLYDYRNRTYSAELGRFVQTDPIGFRAGDVNLYRYVSNNPVNLTDPLGLATAEDVISFALSIVGTQVTGSEFAGYSQALLGGACQKLAHMHTKCVCDELFKDPNNADLSKCDKIKEARDRVCAAAAPNG